jgi:molybdopterin synthase catalytic subunit
MAIKTMSDIIVAAHSLVTRSDHASPSKPTMPILHCSIYHRLGIVPVGEASIVIAVSSPHRKEAFVACEYILEQVKLKVPIWKEEIYDSGESEWKANTSS